MGLYFVVQHQIGGRFSFYNYVNLQINVVICKFVKGFYFVISHQIFIFILFGNLILLQVIFILLDRF